MKLIDLLVQELPRRGGWPEGADYCWQDWDKEIRPASSGFGFYAARLAENHRVEGGRNPGPGNPNCVTREQYDAALAASKQAEWNEGIPPVSTECEIFDCEKWLPVRIKYVGDYLVVVKELDGSLSERVFHIAKHPDKFRPIRTEAERKRDGFIDLLMTEWAFLGQDGEQAGELYDAIATGKIPGIKLSD